ncbi:MAG: DUF2970 domain-containing protein [Proteobacteria bacterium]|nr:DUF2970 domain-containing protein [Pseudomonadota bacterium]HQR03904.1 DUF2970 domain-containing protein [Rhodocyclaceae bacterium]
MSEGRSPWRAALGAMVGLRTRADFERDVAGLNIKHVLAAGVVLMILFVGTLVTIVRWVTR